MQASANIPEEIDRLHNWVIGAVNKFSPSFRNIPERSSIPKLFDGFGSFKTRFSASDELYFLKVSAIENELNKKPSIFFKHIFDCEVFLFGNPSDFNASQSFFGFVIFSASFTSKYFFFLNSISRWTSFLVFLYISQSMLRRLDLNFLNNLPLSLIFPLFPCQTIHYL